MVTIVSCQMPRSSPALEMANTNSACVLLTNLEYSFPLSMVRSLLSNSIHQGNYKGFMGDTVANNTLVRSSARTDWRLVNWSQILCISLKMLCIRFVCLSLDGKRHNNQSFDLSASNLPQIFLASTICGQISLILFISLFFAP